MYSEMYGAKSFDLREVFVGIFNQLSSALIERRDVNAFADGVEFVESIIGDFAESNSIYAKTDDGKKVKVTIAEVLQDITTEKNSLLAAAKNAYAVDSPEYAAQVHSILLDTSMRKIAILSKLMWSAGLFSPIKTSSTIGGTADEPEPS